MFKASSIIAFLFCCLPTVGQTINPNQVRGGGGGTTLISSNYTSLSSLVSACTSSSGGGCDVAVNAPQTFAVTSITIPANVRVVFQVGGSWTLNGNGATVTFAGSIIAPPTSRIFAGTAVVTGLRSARPEWFGDKNAVGTMSLAVNAISSLGGVLDFNATTYRSDYDLTPYARPNIWWRGVAGQTFPAAGSYTAITGGTVIQGRFTASSESTSGWHVSDIGFDAGTAVCTALYVGNFSNSGHCPDAFYSTTASNTVWNYGSRFENLWFLGSGPGVPQHAAAFEGYDSGSWENIHLVGNVYGMVIKGPHDTISDVYSYGHSSNAFLAKSDTEHSSTYDLNITNLNTGDWGSDTTVGFSTQGTDAAILGINLTGYNYRGSAYGIYIGGSSGFLNSNINISNFNITCTTGGVALVMQNSNDSTQFVGGTINGCAAWADTSGATTNMRISEVNMQGPAGAQLRGYEYLENTHIENPNGYTNVPAGVLTVLGFSSHATNPTGYTNLNANGGQIVSGAPAPSVTGTDGTVQSFSAGTNTGYLNVTAGTGTTTAAFRLQMYPPGMQSGNTPLIFDPGAPSEMLHGTADGTLTNHVGGYNAQGPINTNTGYTFNGVAGVTTTGSPCSLDIRGGIIVSATGNCAGTSSGGGTSSTGPTYLQPSNDTTGATDNAAIQSAINAATSAIHLTAGNWYITGLTWAAPTDLYCDDLGGTFINKATASGDWLTVAYGGGQANNESVGMTVRGCNFRYKSGVSGTGGYVFNLSGLDSTHYLSGLHVENNSLYGVAGGFYLGSFMVNNYISHNFVDRIIVSGGSCMYYNTATPGGDANVDGLQCTGDTYPPDLTIAQSDTNSFTNLKLNGGAKVKFLGLGFTKQVTLLNPSIEGATTCAISFPTSGTLPTNIALMGGEMAASSSPSFCNYTGKSQIAYQFMDDLSADGNPGWVSNLYGTGTAGSMSSSSGGSSPGSDTADCATSDNFTSGSGSVVSANHSCFTGIATGGYGGDAQRTSTGLATNPVGGVSALIDTGITTPNDVAVRATYTGNPNTGADQIMVRMASSGLGYSWFFQFNSVYKYVTGMTGNASYKVISGSCPTPSAGDVVELKVVGLTFTCTDITTGVSNSAADTFANPYTTGYVGLAVDERTNSSQTATAFSIIPN